METQVERSHLSGEQLQRWSGLPVACFEANPDVVLSCESSSIPRVCMLDQGRGMFDLGRDVRELKPGATGLFVPEGFSGRKRLRCTPGRRIVLTIDLELLTRSGLVDDELAAPQLRFDPEFYDPDLAGVMRAMVSEVSLGCPNGSLLAQSLSLGVLLRLAGTHAQRAPIRRERGRLSTAQVRRIDELIELHLTSEITLDALAGAVGLSKAHFTRLFRNTVGTSPYRHVLTKRVKAAAELVKSSAAPLAEIALQAGFASQSHMTESFSRVLGIPPGALRKAGSEWLGHGAEQV